MNFIIRFTHFADDNTISGAQNTIEKLACTLEKESQTAIEWFKCTNEIVNQSPNKFQVVMIKRSSKMDESYVLFIDGETVNSEKTEEVA